MKELKIGEIKKLVQTIEDKTITTHYSDKEAISKFKKKLQKEFNLNQNELSEALELIYNTSSLKSIFASPQMLFEVHNNKKYSNTVKKPISKFENYLKIIRDITYSNIKKNFGFKI
jgi:pimeloyl-CoA synthetase